MTRRIAPTLVIIVLAACGVNGREPQRTGQTWDAQRTRMVAEQLRARDIRDARVLAAMLAVPRHEFVPEPQRADAYGDFPLPIGYSQTISSLTSSPS